MIWIVILILFAGAGIVLYAANSQPTLGDVKESGVAADQVFASFKEIRTAWFNEIKDLIQLLLVSLLVPVLTVVIGHIFGQQQSAAGEDS